MACNGGVFGFGEVDGGEVFLDEVVGAGAGDDADAFSFEVGESGDVGEPGGDDVVVGFGAGEDDAEVLVLGVLAEGLGFGVGGEGYVGVGEEGGDAAGDKAGGGLGGGVVEVGDGEDVGSVFDRFRIGGDEKAVYGEREEEEKRVEY